MAGATKQVSVRISAEGGQKMRAELMQIGQVGERAFGQIVQSSRAANGALQNGAFQVQDFFVQVGAGTDPMRALAQQLPQLLGGMGLFGVLAGTAVAAIVPFAGSLFDLGQKAANLDEGLQTLKGSIGDYESSIDLAATSTADLYEKFGAFAGQVQGFAEYMSGVHLGESLDDLSSAVDPLKGNLLKVQTAFLNLAEARDRFAKIRFEDDPEYWMRSKEAVGLYEDALNSASENVGLLPDQAMQLAELMDQLGKAKSMEEIAAASGAVLSYMSQIVPLGTELPAPLRESAAALQDIQNRAAAAAKSTLDLAASAPGTGWMTTAIGETNLLIGRLIEAKTQADALQGLKTSDMAGQYAAYGQGRQQSEQLVRENSPLYGGDGNVLNNGRSGNSNSGRSTGGGISAAQQGQTEMMREAQRVFEQTRTDAERYSAETEKLNRMLDAGAISADTYQRAIEMVGEKYGQVSDASQAFQGITDDLKDAFLDLATGGEAAFDQIAKSIQRAELQAIIFGEGPLAGLFAGGKQGGGLLSGLFGAFKIPSFAGGGYTGGGARAGGLDGIGGYLAMLHPNETVYDHTHRGAGGQFRMPTQNVIINNYSGAEVTQQRGRGPNGEDIVRITVGKQLVRGEHDGSMRSRFGARPPAVKR